MSAGRVRAPRPLVAGLAAALLVALPVGIGVGYALLAALDAIGPFAGPPSTARIARVLAEPAVRRGLAWSLWVALASTALSTALAAGLAAGLRGSGRTDRLGRTLALLPLPVPHVAAALAALLILGQSGLLARVARAVGLIAAPAAFPPLVYDDLGIGLILALTWKETPFLALVAFSLLARRGPAAEEAARSLGAGRWATFRRVTWPFLWPGFRPAVVAVFAFVFGTYEAAALLAPSDPLALPLLIMERWTDPALERRGDAYALALVALLVAAVAVAVHEVARARGARADA